MKARLKYPIFSFAPKGNMIYVFRKEELYTTTNTELLKKRKNYIVVDATGTKYVEKGAHKVKWQGIFGYCIRMQGRVISIEYEYGDNPEPFPLRKLQELVAERSPRHGGSRKNAGTAQTSSGKRFSPARPLRKWRTY